VAEARLDLLEAQADLIDLQNDTSTANKLYDLREEEAERSAEYTRLANEGYYDAFYQDRLRTSDNAQLDSREAVVRTETQAEILLLNARMRVRQAEQTPQDALHVLAQAEAGADDLDAANAKLNIAEAEVALAEAQEQRAELDAGVDPVKLASARASLGKKRLALSEAQEAWRPRALSRRSAGRSWRLRVPGMSCI